MAEPNYTVLAALVIAQDATYHTTSAPVWEQIQQNVWMRYRDASDIQPKVTVDDVAGLGATIYAAFIAAGLTEELGGVAYALSKIGNIVMTYPYTRADNNVLDVPTP